MKMSMLLPALMKPREEELGEAFREGAVHWGLVRGMSSPRWENSAFQVQRTEWVKEWRGEEVQEQRGGQGRGTGWASRSRALCITKGLSFIPQEVRDPGKVRR